ncbi:MAG: thioredoxin domain-containing protein [Actinomycetota bacterium]
MSNRLADAASPYLLQHKDNPVDWHEWGDDAFAEARDTDRPILLSIGYSACHWCHVMAHESFEDPATAEFLNTHFVSIKVDREERPDVDRIYMDAVTALVGQGGWPLTAFLTPDGEPFFGGTYFPKDQLHGRASFMDVLAAISDAWRTRRDELVRQAARLAGAVRGAVPVAHELPDETAMLNAVASLSGSFDSEHGGFGRAPKFPQAPTLELVMRTAAFGGPGADYALGMLDVTLTRMARGGIYDHLDGGFARYSVDREWVVPHFEKMLYDNALLSRTYLRTWQLTSNDLFLSVATETLDYLLTDMHDPAGGFHSAEDADSEGVEGKFYVWSWEELGDVLGRDREAVVDIYGATPGGNFEGTNILVRSDEPFDPDEKAHIDQLLRNRRRTRVRPGLDDKVVTAWNGLAMRAFAEAGTVLGEQRYTDAAVGIAAFLSAQFKEQGKLLRSWRHGRPGPAGFCDDYAAAAIGLFTLYQATGDPQWYEFAERLTREMIERFGDPDGGFFATAHDAEALIARPKNVQDNPTPSDNALAAEALLMLAAYTGESELWARFENTVRSTTAVMARHPAFAGQTAALWITYLHGLKEVAVVDAAHLEAVVWERFRPEVVLATGGSVPLLSEREPGKAYVCRNMVCDLPATTVEALREQLSR